MEEIRKDRLIDRRRVAATRDASLTTGPTTVKSSDHCDLAVEHHTEVKADSSCTGRAGGWSAHHGERALRRFERDRRWRDPGPERSPARRRRSASRRRPKMADPTTEHHRVRLVVEERNSVTGSALSEMQVAGPGAGLDAVGDAALDPPVHHPTPRVAEVGLDQAIRASVAALIASPRCGTSRRDDVDLRVGGAARPAGHAAQSTSPSRR